VPHPLPRWCLVRGEQGASRPVLRAGRSPVGTAADRGEIAAGGVIFSPTDRGVVAASRIDKSPADRGTSTASRILIPDCPGEVAAGCVCESPAD
jgi:hypothetical protein